MASSISGDQRLVNTMIADVNSALENVSGLSGSLLSTVIAVITNAIGEAAGILPTSAAASPLDTFTDPIAVVGGILPTNTLTGLVSVATNAIAPVTISPLIAESPLSAVTEVPSALTGGATMIGNGLLKPGNAAEHGGVLKKVAAALEIPVDDVISSLKTQIGGKPTVLPVVKTVINSVTTQVPVVGMVANGSPTLMPIVDNPAGLVGGGGKTRRKERDQVEES